MASVISEQSRSSSASSRGAGRGGARGGGQQQRRKNNTNARANGPNTNPANLEDSRASASGTTKSAPTTDLVASTAALAITPATGTEGEDGVSTQGDDEACWLCAEPIKFSSVSSCNHRTCHVCALRLRALYKKMECAFCKTPQPRVIFTTSRTQPWDAYTPDSIPFKDEKLRIAFEDEDMMQETLFLLRFNCPDTECTFTGTGWADLKYHTRDIHGLILCDLCIRHKKIFAHEHTLYTPKQLMQHLPNLRRPPPLPAHQQAQQQKGKGKDPDKGKSRELGDEGGGAEEEKVDFVHPQCTFCHECYYGDDELYLHLRERHEECFVCKRMGESNVYFQNYEKLEGHFSSVHFPCPHPTCVENKFVVFSSALDLQAHQLEVHGQTMGAKERKEKKKIEIGFTFQDVPTRGGGRGGRGRGGGRGADAGERGGAGAGSSRRAQFGGHLSGSGQGASGTNTPDEGADDVDVLPSSDLVPLQVHLKSLSQSAQFHVISSVRSFRGSECTAKEMLDTLFNTFDRNLETMGAVVAHVEEIFESNAEKKGQVREGWEGIKVEERNRFPSVAPVASSSNAQSGGWAGIASGQLINIKKSTSQRPSRVGKGQQSRRVWDRIEQAATSSTPLVPVSAAVAARNRMVPGNNSAASSSSSLRASEFPTLGAASSNADNAARNAAQRQTPWASSSASHNNSSNTINLPPVLLPLAPQAPSPAPMQPFSVSSSTPAPARAAPVPLAQFPSLQASSSARQRPPAEFLSGNRSAKNIRGAAPAAPRSVWGAGASSGGDNGPNANNAGAEPQNGQEKKKKKGKETLFTLGAHPGPA